LLLSVALEPLVVVNATGCLEVISTIYPYSAWPVPWLHNAFENAAATASGVEAAAKALFARGRIARIPKIVAIGGDGGTYERGHNFLYICYNNEGYMNTGIQRSSATPAGARTTTTPVGIYRRGKLQPRKDLTEIVVAHGVRYAAQASISHWGDLAKKLQKALATTGPTFLNVLTPCPLGWDYPPEEMVEVAQLAVQTRYWPLYEVEEGRYRLTYIPRKPLPVRAWLERQGRFRHLLDDPEAVARFQAWVDANWNRLVARTRAEIAGDLLASCETLT